MSGDGRPPDMKENRRILIVAAKLKARILSKPGDESGARSAPAF